MPTKSILVNYSGYPYIVDSLLPDNGLALLAASLIQKGHETKILDYAVPQTMERLFPFQYKDEIASLYRNPGIDAERIRCLDEKINDFRKGKIIEIAKEISEHAKKENVDFVGFKLWLGEGFEGSIAIAEYLKEQNPGLPIFAGGPQVDWFGELILEKTNAFDALAYGEGEETIIHLADHIKGKKRLDEIPNLIFKKGKEIIKTPLKRIEDLDSLPTPLYDESVYPAIKDKIHIFLLDESRGCPYSCNFCTHSIKSGKKWRTKDPKKVIDEIRSFSKTTGAFRFSGSNTPSYFKREFAKELISQGLDIHYTGFGHFEDTSKETLQLFRKSGGYALLFGLESGSQEILDKSINKRIKIFQVKKLASECQRQGIKTILSVISPAPLETEQTKNQTLDLLLESKPDSVLVSLPILVRGSEWINNSQRYNFTLNKGNINNFYKELMDYRIKLLYPPSLWDPLPYSINNKSFSDCSKESGEFASLLENSGILTQATDVMFSMAKYSNLSVKELRDSVRSYFSEGNSQEVRALVKTINKNVGKY